MHPLTFWRLVSTNRAQAEYLAFSGAVMSAESSYFSSCNIRSVKGSWSLKTSSAKMSATLIQERQTRQELQNEQTEVRYVLPR